MSEIEIVCPGCGNQLLRSEDKYGVTYQCDALDCLQLWDADEVEHSLATVKDSQ